MIFINFQKRSTVRDRLALLVSGPQADRPVVFCGVRYVVENDPKNKTKPKQGGPRKEMSTYPQNALHSRPPPRCTEHSHQSQHKYTENMAAWVQIASVETPDSSVCVVVGTVHSRYVHLGQGQRKRQALSCCGCLKLAQQQVLSCCF